MKSKIMGWIYFFQEGPESLINRSNVLKYEVKGILWDFLEWLFFDRTLHHELGLFLWIILRTSIYPSMTIGISPFFLLTLGNTSMKKYETSIFNPSSTEQTLVKSEREASKEPFLEFSLGGDKSSSHRLYFQFYC